jgi:hypothetical protein
VPSQQDSSMRQPKGDHNRRLALGMDIEAFAAEAGLTREQVHEYEMTSPDHKFDGDVARRYGAALDRLEANPPDTQIVQNTPTVPANPPKTRDVPAPAFKDAVSPGAPDQPALVRPAGPGAMRDAR